MIKGLKVFEEIKEKYKDDNGLQRRLKIIEKSIKALNLIIEKYHLSTDNIEGSYYLDNPTFSVSLDENEYELLCEVLQ